MGPTDDAFQPAFGPPDVECLGDDVLYRGFFEMRRVRLRHRLFEGGWSSPVARELFLREDAVGVLPFDPERDAVVLIEQFRVGAWRDPASPWLLELVAGIIEPDEAPEDVARRESLEEAGCMLTALMPVARYYVSPGGTTEQFHVFCGCVDAGAAGGVHGLAEEHEDIRVHVFPRTDVPDLLAGGHVRNAHTWVALQWLLLHHERVRRAWR